MGDFEEKEDLQIIKPGNGLHKRSVEVSVHLHQVGVGDREPEQRTLGHWTAIAFTRKRGRSRWESLIP